MQKFLIVFIIPVLALVSACAKDLSSGSYSETQAGEADSTYEGVIVSLRTVKIKPETKENTAGTLAGGALGAAGGSAIGKGTGSVVSAIGGAIVGAVAGNAAEGALKTTTAVEYVVKTKADNNGGKTQNIPQAGNKGAKTIKAGGLVTVVQATDPALKKGTKVYVIISKKNRSRIIAM